jgi:hypothetical protein
MRYLRSGGLVVLVLGSVVAAGGQAAAAPIEWTVAPYVMFAGMSGTVAIEEWPAASVNRSSPGPFTGLNAGPGVYFEVRQGAWSFALNLSEVSLSQTIEPYPLVADGDNTLTGTLTTKQTVMDAYFFWHAKPKWDVLFGVNGHHVGTIINGTFEEVTGAGCCVAEDVNENYPHAWLTAVVGGRWTPVDGERWHVVVFGDVGGWKAKNWTWQVLPSAGYKVSKLFEISAQYRALYVEYTNGSPPTPTFTDEGYLQYRTLTYGPQLAAVFHF